MTKLIPFLRFNDGRCREAMNFYQSCLGGKLNFMTVAESPMAKDFPPDKHSLVMHSELVKGDIRFSGSDMMRDRALIGDHVGMSLECGSEKELRDHFSKLKEGGEVFMEPEEQFWGAVYGMLTDKYGVEWMFSYDKKAK